MRKCHDIGQLIKSVSKRMGFGVTIGHRSRDNCVFSYTIQVLKMEYIQNVIYIVTHLTFEL